MTSCTFCKVVTRELDTALVREDDTTIAFMDLRQPTWPDGAHVLVVPKVHVEQVDQLEPELAGNLMVAVVAVAQAVREQYAPAGMSVWSSNGPAAFQEVPHVHMHVLSRKHDDGLLRVYQASPLHPPLSELEEAAALLRPAVS